MAVTFIPIADCVRDRVIGATETATGYSVSLARSREITFGFSVDLPQLPAGYERATFEISARCTSPYARLTKGYQNSSGDFVQAASFPWSEDVKSFGADILYIKVVLKNTSTSTHTFSVANMGLSVDVPESTDTNLRLGEEEITGAYLGSEEVTGAYLGDNKLF